MDTKNKEIAKLSEYLDSYRRDIAHLEEHIAQQFYDDKKKKDRDLDKQDASADMKRCGFMSPLDFAVLAGGGGD